MFGGLACVKYIMNWWWRKTLVIYAPVITFEAGTVYTMHVYSCHCYYILIMENSSAWFSDLAAWLMKDKWCARADDGTLTDIQFADTPQFLLN